MSAIVEQQWIYCPKCKQESLIQVKELNISVIKDPDAEPMNL
ncbi:MAG TPA: hypothetical protein DEP23_02865 [Ruminococcaceae bacterium]|nr:hypothetical protein [Oscillospiraceae bacterium]